MQCILSALVAIIIALAPVFNIPLTVVPPKGELPHESEPAPSELSIYDKVVGVDDSVFYISRPNTENLKIIYASDFGMDSNSQDNTDLIDFSCTLELSSFIVGKYIPLALSNISFPITLPNLLI